jgi:aspartate aminotransferase
VLEENARRGRSERPLYVMYDQVYWMLTFGSITHVDPVSLRPEMRDYTVFVDGISKAFAATGVRVGWTVAPPDVSHRMASLLGHIGAWAPRAEQTATAKLLTERERIVEFHDGMKEGVQSRLDALYKGLSALASDGLPVEAIAPMGAIYLSARFALNGRRTRSGQTLHTNDQIRHYLLHEAGLAIVPFQAFGMTEDSGWFRLSVGATSVQEIEAMLPMLRQALEGIEAEA